MTRKYVKKAKLCGAKRHNTDETCRKPAGWGTDHNGRGRCKYHGGATPSGPKSAHFKHGRYADAFKEKMAEKFNEIANEPEPFDLLPELYVQRTMLQSYLRTIGKKETFVLAEVEAVIDMAETVAKTAAKIMDTRNKTALTSAEIQFVWGGMKEMLEKYVPDVGRRKAFIEEVRAYVIGRLDAGGEE